MIVSFFKNRGDPASVFCHDMRESLLKRLKPSYLVSASYKNIHDTSTSLFHYNKGNTTC